MVDVHGRLVPVSRDVESGVVRPHHVEWDFPGPLAMRGSGFPVRLRSIVGLGIRGILEWCFC